mmetsp:Transcript_47917/g.96683  ORF Transcript_47917/g.96683 Transcript_47917/m.96683 type:complete len:215 (+) Transcript_47917:106-750(+)
MLLGREGGNNFKGAKTRCACSIVGPLLGPREWTRLAEAASQVTESRRDPHQRPAPHLFTTSNSPQALPAALLTAAHPPRARPRLGEPSGSRLRRPPTPLTRQPCRRASRTRRPPRPSEGSASLRSSAACSGPERRGRRAPRTRPCPGLRLRGDARPGRPSPRRSRAPHRPRGARAPRTAGPRRDPRAATRAPLPCPPSPRRRRRPRARPASPTP